MIRSASCILGSRFTVGHAHQHNIPDLSVSETQNVIVLNIQIINSNHLLLCKSIPSAQFIAITTTIVLQQLLLLLPLLLF